MPLDYENIDKLTKALSDKVAESVSNSLGDQMKESMEQLRKAQAQDLKANMDSIMNTMLKTQESFEAKTDQKINELGDSLSKRQDIAEKENASKFSDISEQLTILHKVVSQKQANPSTLPPVQTPRPPPTFANFLGLISTKQPRTRPEDLKTIQDIVKNARVIVGLGPISAEHIEKFEGASPDEKLLSAVKDFLRNELSVRKSEIEDEDIEKVFHADHASLERVYVQLQNSEQVELCRTLMRMLKKPSKIQVVLYIP